MSKPLLAGVPALLLASAALAQPSGDARPVMVILAHPDDELPMAPALSALARAEADVRLGYAAMPGQASRSWSRAQRWLPPARTKHAAPPGRWASVRR